MKENFDIGDESWKNHHKQKLLLDLTSLMLEDAQRMTREMIATTYAMIMQTSETLLMMNSAGHPDLQIDPDRDFQKFLGDNMPPQTGKEFRRH